MWTTNARSSTEEKLARPKKSLDLEAQVVVYPHAPNSISRSAAPVLVEAVIRPDNGLISVPTLDVPSCLLPRQQERSSAIQKLLCYPSSSPLKLGPTSWLDGVRGVAALGVYIFHAMGCWASLAPAWHSDEDQFNILQMPVLRTVFVSGGAAVSLFFTLSGFVLTYKSLRWMREGQKHLVYPALASSMFRRGFRLYMPPILLTFCEMLATRFGYIPPLNFSFVPELTFPSQFVDWLAETNRLVNPVHNMYLALRGFATHPKYDPVIWTLPLEFYGSFVCYILLFILVQIPSNSVRMFLVAVFSASCMGMGSWNVFCFSAGMLVADFNLSQEEKGTIQSPARQGKIWTTLFAISFYVAGFPSLLTPEAKINPMPGFETLRSVIPLGLNMEDHSRFWWSISGVSLLLSISQLPRFKCLFETNFCQYLGKISFSLYLIHEFCLVLFGLRLQTFVMHLASLEPHDNTLVYWLVCGIWYILFTVPVFAMAAQVEKWVDVRSVRFARLLEGKCLEGFRRLLLRKQN
jgi:peptidoglycan/LPS O-acetylase OafA/YrhL